MELVKGKFYHIKKGVLDCTLDEDVAEYHSFYTHSANDKELHRFICRDELGSLDIAIVLDEEILGEADVTEI